MTHDCRMGGGVDPGCTLSQISRFNSVSSASSASAKSRVGIRERKAVGLSSRRGHVFGRWTNDVESGRRVKAFHRGVAAASYWLSGGRPRIPSMVRRTDAVVRSEEHTSELQSQLTISYAVFCSKKKSVCVRGEERFECGRPYVLCVNHHSNIVFFFNVTATTEIYTVSYTLSLHDALPI